LILPPFRGLIPVAGQGRAGEDSPRTFAHTISSSGLSAYRNARILLASGIPGIRVDL